MNINILHTHKSKPDPSDYECWARNLIEEKSEFDLGWIKSKTSGDESDYNMREHTFFMTFHIRRSEIIEIGEAQEYVYSLFDRYYNRLSDTLTSPCGRASKYRPYIVSAFDTEYGRGPRIAGSASIPHLHGIALIHPKKLEFFKQIHDWEVKDGKGYWVKRNPVNGVDSVSFLPVDINEPGDTILKYAFKSVAKLSGSDFDRNLFEIHPAPNDRNYPFNKLLKLKSL